MSFGRIKGVNAQGHHGWVSVRCRVCNKKLDTTRNVVFKCPKCATKYDAYFCEADARVLHYRCPFCNEQLVSYV